MRAHALLTTQTHSAATQAILAQAHCVHFCKNTLRSLNTAQTFMQTNTNTNTLTIKQLRALASARAYCTHAHTKQQQALAALQAHYAACTLYAAAQRTQASYACKQCSKLQMCYNTATAHANVRAHVLHSLKRLIA
jgi:hypothetical protein